ncbi:hypothetical protein CVT26_011467, partial [Gymnopilus dilepis]
SDHRDDPAVPSKKRKVGRPKGSKDGPRHPNAPPRGRPRHATRTPETGSGVHSEIDHDITAETDDEFEYDEISSAILLGLEEIEAANSQKQGTSSASTPGSTLAPGHVKASRKDRAPTDSRERELQFRHLRKAVERSQARPFFSQKVALGSDQCGESEDDADADDEVDNGPLGGRAESGGDGCKEAWFAQPKYMPDWLYKYFSDVVAPLIFTKDGRTLQQPSSFTDNKVYSPPSFWLGTVEPVFSLSRHNFRPEALYRPRVFLWLPHFFVSDLRCPSCRLPLEKNGACPPRRVTDIEDSFYIVTWNYYCRKGCRKYFRGWNPMLLGSLPRYLQLAFPAVLSRKSGLSHRIISQLRVGNQHKMGPAGVRSLLLEMHTRKFNVLQVQYLEAVFELVRGRQEIDSQSQATSQTQTLLHQYIETTVPPFGDFGDCQRYSGFVPSERYLARMLNKCIERDERDANQHTSCLPPDQIAIDDSHKVNKHMAKEAGSPVYNALWTCMDSRYIRAQVLAFTKAHEERNGALQGIADSTRRYGFDQPKIAFSDDPVKDSSMLRAAFPSLFESLTPMAAAYGLKSIDLPDSVNISWLGTAELAENMVSTIMSGLEDSADSHIWVGFDAEWNISRQVGVSIIQLAPSSMPLDIFVIPVHKFRDRLPPSLLRLLISDRVFKVGSNVKGDLSRLQKQFPQLSGQLSFNVIDLKLYCVDRGIIARKDAGSLEVLCQKVLHSYLPKPDALRRHDNWETPSLGPDYLNYASLDVYATRLIFEEASKRALIERPSFDSPSGTKVALLIQEGGDPIAYGKISNIQPPSFDSIRLKTPQRNRLLIDIDDVLNPAAAAILHVSRNSRSKTKSGAFTLGELRAASSNSTFKVVSPTALLAFDLRTPEENQRPSSIPLRVAEPPNDDRLLSCISQYEEDPLEPVEDFGADDQAEAINEGNLEMLEAYSAITQKQQGKQRELDSGHPFPDASFSSDFILSLQELVNKPPDMNDVYTKVKKDIFHAFHMIPVPVNHGLRPAFLRSLRDHLLRWDPDSRSAVHAVCQEAFNLTFDQMLARNPRFIAERTPRFIPSPSILVPAISHVFNTFGNALDAKTNQPLFTKRAWEKANAVLELARQGYLSDNPDVILYEKAGIDKYGLQKWRCLRGTNKVEGGPHGDIYRKFGALNDHRTWYNLQAYAAHQFGLDWDYHHDLGLINRTAFLLNYLSDSLDGAKSYADWTNGDLYEVSIEQFGICAFPGPFYINFQDTYIIDKIFCHRSDALRIRLAMDPYTDGCETVFPLNPSDDWLRKRQKLALPVLPPTTPEARQYFFKKFREITFQIASNGGQGKVDYEGFAKEWNRTADGKYRYYVTTEVLTAYAKSWEKNTNIKASQELISEQLQSIRQTAQVFAAPIQEFPEYLTSSPYSYQPNRGLLDIGDELDSLPASISTSLTTSHPIILPQHTPSTSYTPYSTSHVTPALSHCLPTPIVLSPPPPVPAPQSSLQPDISFEE